LYARTTQLEFLDSDDPEGIRAWEKTMELSKQEEGFLEAMLLVQENSHRALSISFWRSKEDCEKTSRTGPGTLIARAVPILRPFLKADPIFTPYNVRSRLK
jgi:hypothetical protein